MKEKNEQVPIQLPSVARTLSDAEKIIKKIFPWTSEIIQFIRFENHMDGRYLKFVWGNRISYLSIYFQSPRKDFLTIFLASDKVLAMLGS